MDILKEIENLEREIERATREQNQAEGRVEAMTASLKKEFGIDVKQVEKKKKKMDIDLQDLSVEIETLFKELKENYEWE